VLNEAAFGYLRGRGLPALVITSLADAGKTGFVNKAEWLAQLGRLGIVSPPQTGLAVIQDCGFQCIAAARYDLIAARLPI
jgi:hypothetical protein